ncbi:Follicular epithelium yolk protein subunit [Operophtera brumata]|uniref:Follicular epithelium yolk protein subunit n=1 Tax=Operophtera brumata TaxID=104452 RepID=A0A0L7LLV8_OPEBR|nr:Follicular epithelium yolk protein subunit [Operophtera brumata]
MKVTFLFMCLSIKLIESKIKIDIVAESNGPLLTSSGANTQVASESDIELFFTDSDNLKQAVTTHYGKKPKNIYYKSPTPWGDLYKTQIWEEVTKITSFESYRVKSASKTPVVVLTQDFENNSNNTVKVNTGISHTVENTLTTSWTTSKELELSQELEYDVNVYFSKISGTTGISYTSTWGQGEEKSESVTIGSTSAVETELKPGQAVTAVLSVNTGLLEIEVFYKTSLRGNLAVNFKRAHEGHHFWGPQVKDVMKSAGIENRKSTMESIKIGYNIDAKLKHR